MNRNANETAKKIKEAIALRQRQIAELERQRALRPTQPELELQIEEHRREIAKLQEQLLALEASGKSAPGKSKSTDIHQEQPPALLIPLVFSLIILLIFGAEVYLLRDRSPLIILLVCVTSVLVLYLMLVFTALLLRQLSENNFVKLMREVLEKVPGLGQLITLIEKKSFGS